MICKFKVCVNIYGVFNVESGYYVEDQEVEEEIKEESDKKEGDVSIFLICENNFLLVDFIQMNIMGGMEEVFVRLLKCCKIEVFVISEFDYYVGVVGEEDDDE